MCVAKEGMKPKRKKEQEGMVEEREQLNSFHFIQKKKTWGPKSKEAKLRNEKSGADTIVDRSALRARVMCEAGALTSEVLKKETLISNTQQILAM